MGDRVEFLPAGSLQKGIRGARAAVNMRQAHCLGMGDDSPKHEFTYAVASELGKNVAGSRPRG